MYYFHIYEENYYESVFSSEELIRTLPNLENAELSYYTSWGNYLEEQYLNMFMFQKES